MVSLEDLRDSKPAWEYLFLFDLVAALLDDLDEVLLDSFLEAAWDLVRQRLRATRGSLRSSGSGLLSWC